MAGSHTDTDANCLCDVCSIPMHTYEEQEYWLSYESKGSPSQGLPTSSETSTVSNTGGKQTLSFTWTGKRTYDTQYVRNITIPKTGEYVFHIKTSTTQGTVATFASNGKAMGDGESAAVRYSKGANSI